MTNDTINNNNKDNKDNNNDTVATATDAAPDDDNDLRRNHLDWTNKQGRILTANGRANEYYTKQNGFPFQNDELPHHHLINGNTHKVFAEWASKLSATSTTTTAASSSSSDDGVPTSTTTTALPDTSPICGAWSRPLFCGEWEHSTSNDETVFNIQTNSLFIDLRIPKSRRSVIPTDGTDKTTVTSLGQLSDEELRLYARQHIFGGYSVISKPSLSKPQVTMNNQKAQVDDRPCCVRHHCIDWNFVGVGRPRPNKWWIDMHRSEKMWKEVTFATDHHGQHYYMERWERVDGDSNGSVRLALRKRSMADGIVVVVGVSMSPVLAMLVMVLVMVMVVPTLVMMIRVPFVCRFTTHVLPSSFLMLPSFLTVCIVFHFTCVPPGSLQLLVGTVVDRKGTNTWRIVVGGFG